MLDDALIEQFAQELETAEQMCTQLDTMRYTCRGGEVLRIPVKSFIAQRVEVKLAFILKRELKGSGITVEDVMTATDDVTPAIEIIDARIGQFDRYTKVPRKVFDTISDNAANVGIALGDIATDLRYRINPQSADLPWVVAICRYNGVVEETGLAAGVQGHPAVGIA
jgi:2-oxo-hept-3-ene-1,7-dioate hydratase